MFVLVPLALLQLLSVSGELVEEVVDDVRVEDLDPEGVGQLLGVFLNLHVERKYRGVSVPENQNSMNPIIINQLQNKLINPTRIELFTLNLLTDCRAPT